MYGWIPVVLYLFMRFPAQRAIVVSFLTALLFLPEVSFPLLGLPDYTKISATCYGILLATFIYDVGRFSSYKFGWLDVPMLCWCLCPLLSSISNNLGPYDGFSATLGQTMTWGIPYFLGRIYLNNLAGLRQLAIGIFISGLIYVPLCLYEIRFSPQLHRMLYGYHPHADFSQTIRYDGYRPQVFMNHGLWVGLWMMTATLIGIWLWKTGVIKQLWGIHIKWLVAAILITFILCKSTGAYLYLVLGMTILFLAWRFRTSFLLSLLIGLMSLYIAQCTLTETNITNQIITSLRGVIPQERLLSLEFRFKNEDLLADKAREKILLGWGGWGRNRIYDYDWNGKLIDVSVTDSVWIITFGSNGLVGLISLLSSFFLPVIGFVQRYPASLWKNRQVAPAAALVVILALFMLDCLLNAMVNPVFALVCGGVTGVALKERETLLKDNSSPTKSSLAPSAIRGNLINKKTKYFP
jgi:hypothetical protein